MVDAFHFIFQMQIKLSQERDQLAMTVKKLGRDLSKVRVEDLFVVEVKSVLVT